MGCDKNRSQREVYSNSISPQETKLSNEQSALTDKVTREGQQGYQKRNRISRRKNIIKIKVEVNRNENSKDQ